VALRTHPLRIGIVAAAALAASISAQITVPTTPPPKTRAGGNITAKAPTGPVPRKANGQPDLGGVWLRRAGIVNIADLLPKGETLPLRPETLKRMSLLKSQDDPQLRCLPVATPRSEPYPFRIVETPTYIFILMEAVHGYRQVFMDGRKHPSGDDLQLSWQGHSIGRWEANTLVVDTIGFNDLTWFDNWGHIHSDKMHVVERFTRADLGHLNASVLVDDPGAYSRPFTLNYTAELMPTAELMEYICDNEQDAANIDAPADAAIEAAKLLGQQR
jgi:hypothetical protein